MHNENNKLNSNQSLKDNNDSAFNPKIGSQKKTPGRKNLNVIIVIILSYFLLQITCVGLIMAFIAIMAPKEIWAMCLGSFCVLAIISLLLRQYFFGIAIGIIQMLLGSLIALLGLYARPKTALDLAIDLNRALGLAFLFLTIGGIILWGSLRLRRHRLRG